jgi:hypothetical protein
MKAQPRSVFLLEQQRQKNSHCCLHNLESKSEDTSICGVSTAVYMHRPIAILMSMTTNSTYRLYHDTVPWPQANSDDLLGHSSI